MIGHKINNNKHFLLDIPHRPRVRDGEVLRLWDSGTFHRALGIERHEDSLHRPRDGSRQEERPNPRVTASSKPYSARSRLLAGLPKTRAGNWMRGVPTNHRYSVYANGNALVYLELRGYYDDIRSLTRGPVRSLSRFGTILRFLAKPPPGFSGWGAPSAKQSRSTATTYEVFDAPRLAVEPQGGARWDAPGKLVMYGYGIEVVFSRPEKLIVIDTSLDGNDTYRFEYFDGTGFRDLFNLGPASVPEMGQYAVRPAGIGLAHYRRAVPPKIPATTRLRIIPSGGDSNFSIGQLTTR